MQRVVRAIPNPSSNTYTVTNKPVYKRFHRKPQIYPTSFQTNKTYKIETHLEQDNINNYLSNIYKEKKFRGVLDPTSPNNKDIFIDTDSEPQKSEKKEGKVIHPLKKSAKLLIAKTESQFPQTYNSQNIFQRDGLIRGYYIKVKDPNNKPNDNIYNTYNTLTTNNRMAKSIMQTPSAGLDSNVIYDYNQGSQSQIRTKKVNMNFNQTYNRNGYFRKEIDLDEWPSIDKNQNSNNYINKDLLMGDKYLKTDNSNNTENQNINQYHYQNRAKNYPAGMVYRKGNMYDMKGTYSKSNLSDSEEYNQYKINPQNDNYIIEGNNSGIAIGSPYEYNNHNNIEGLSDEESDHQAEKMYFNDNQNYYNKRVINEEIDNNNIPEYHGGKVDLYYGMNNSRDNNREYGIKNKNIIIRRNRYLNSEYIIRNDPRKLDLLIYLQNCIRSYLDRRNECAMKIQAIWRGGNTRRIMELYNDLDEFIYHLSKVQFNHFNDSFCFFINQLFNIYKANISDKNIDQNDEGENNNEDDIDKENENENCMNQITLEEIEKKGGNSDYLYKFPEGACFEPEKLAQEKEIALFVEASSPTQDKKGKKKYDKLLKDYEELYQQYNDLVQKDNQNNNLNIGTNSNRIIPKKEKNESESTFGSAKSEYKFHKFGSNVRDKKNNLGYSDIKKSPEDNGKNLTISNDYDADLDINRDDEFFNQDISYDDKDNNGSLNKNKRYSYFSIHSDENSKFFDNENRKENKEGDTFKINTSKNSGGSKYNNSAKYTGYSSNVGQSKLVGLHKYGNTTKNEYSNSPFNETSNNYIGHHSKTYPRKMKNDNESVNNVNQLLIIPKHEEDFNIINNNMFLSPKERVEEKNRSDIAKTPNIKFEERNWNEIIEYIKNEEIEIPTQKKSKINTNIEKKQRKEEYDKNYKIFDVLEKENINELNIDNNDYRKKRLSQIYVEHENEINIDSIGHKKRKLNKINIEYGDEITIDDSKDFRKRLLSQINIDYGDELKIDDTNDYRKKKLSEITIEYGDEIIIDDSKEYRKNKLNEITIEYGDEIIIDNSKDCRKKQLNQMNIVFGDEIIIDDSKDYQKKKLNQINIEYGKEIIIDDSNDYRKKKLSQMYIEHENELKLGKSQEDIKKEKLLIKEIENKNKEIVLLKNQLEDIINKISSPQLTTESKPQLLIDKITYKEPSTEKPIINQEELSRKINLLIETKLKQEKGWNNLKINQNDNIELVNKEPQKIENIVNNCIQLNIDRIYENKKDNQFNDKNVLQKQIELNIDKTKIIPDTKEETSDTSDLIPKEIKITMKKVVKKTNTIQYRFKNNLVASENQININGKERVQPIFEEESQENNRFSVEKTIKDEKEKPNIISKEIEVHIDNTLNKDLLRTKIINPEEFRVSETSSYAISPDEEKIKDNLNKSLQLIKNDELSLIPKEFRREIKIVTKKIAKRTNHIYSKFLDKKAIISPQNNFDIKGVEKPQSQFIPTDNENKISIELHEDPKQANQIITNENIKEVIKKYNAHKKYDDIINIKSRLTLKGKEKKPEENTIDPKSQFTINGIQKETIEMSEEGIQYEVNKDDLCEKNTDTSDLIPKEIKITMKKTVKKTNVLKGKVKPNYISNEIQFNINGIEKQTSPEEAEKEKLLENIQQNNIIIKSDWNNSLKEEVQQNKFIIEGIQSNIHKQFNIIKDQKEKDEKDIISDIKSDDNKDKEINKTDENKANIEKIVYKEKDWNKLLKEETQQKDFIINGISENFYEKYNKLKNERDIIQKEKEKEEKVENKDTTSNINEQTNQKTQLSPGEEIIKEKDWNKLIKEDVQQNIFVIESNINNISDISEKKNNLRNRKDNQIQDNIIDKNIIFHITGVKDVQQTESQPQHLLDEKATNTNEEEPETKKSQIEIQKNVEINIEPTDLPIDKNKIIEDWKNIISEEKSEILKIDSQPQKREIKITTRKTTKKTNNIYRKFDKLNISQNILSIEGKPRMKSSEYSTDNSQINININKSYESKKQTELTKEKNKEIFINANDYKKKEIRITIKKKVAKVNYVFKRFNNNTISNQSQININGIKPQEEKVTSFANEMLEKIQIEENKFTIDKTEDKSKELEIKENIIKENEEIKNKLENEKNELIKQNEELKDKLQTKSNELKKEKEELKNKYENENNKLHKENEKLKDKLQNEKNLLIKENEELKNKYENQNNELKKEYENLKNKIENDNKENIIEVRRRNILNNSIPMATEEFTLEKEEYVNEDNGEDNELEDLFSVENIQLSIDKAPKEQKELSEQGIQKEESKPKFEEKKTDTFDLEKKDTINTNEDILKKTNVLRHEFKNNSICSETQFKISETKANKPRNSFIGENNIIVNELSLTLNDQNEKFQIVKTNSMVYRYRNRKKNVDNKNLNNSNSIQLLNEQMQNNNESITENTFGDNSQLTNAKLLISKKERTDKNKKDDLDKSASYDEEGDIKSYAKRKVINRKQLKNINKKKKLKSLVIKLFNKFDLKICFNKWNTLTPNLLIKPKGQKGDNLKNNTVNIKQIEKGRNSKDLKLNIINDNNIVKYIDNSNKEKSHEDTNTNMLKLTEDNTFNNFDTINLEEKNLNSLEPFSSINVNDENFKNLNNRLKIKDKEEDIKDNINPISDTDNNLNTLNLNNDYNIDTFKRNSRQSNNSNSINLNDINGINNISHVDTISNEMSSSIDINEKSFLEKNDQDPEKPEEKEEKEEPKEPESPKKKEILINKKICIISKKPKKIKYLEAKKKFFHKRFMIRYWKKWKEDIIKKTIEKEDNNMKSLEQKSTRKPFSTKIGKIPIKRRIDKDNQEKLLSLKNELMSQNKKLITRHFFLQWKKNIGYETEIDIVVGINVMEKILRRYIIRYLLMHGKILKFKKLLIKHIFRKHK